MITPATPRPSTAGEAAESSSSTGRELSVTFLVGATLIILLAAGTAVAVSSGERFGPAHALELRRVFWMVSALCALSVLFLCQARWHQIPENAPLWAGTATMLVGVAAATRPELLGPILAGHAPESRVLLAVSNASIVVASACFAAGLMSAFHHWALRPWWLPAGALPLVAAVALVFHAFPGVGTDLTLSSLPAAEGAGALATGLATAGLWLFLAVGYTVRGLGNRWEYTWGGLVLFALALSGLATRSASGSGNPWEVVAAALPAAALVVAVVACSLELSRAYEEQALRLFDSELDAEAADLRERLRAASFRSRRHDLANAITAIEGAAGLLERDFQALSDDDRAALGRVLGSGTSRLWTLLGQEGGAGAQLSLAEAASTAVRELDWRDGLELDVEADLTATGSATETVEALRQLLHYAHRRSPDDPVLVRGERDGSWAVLRVEDRGPTLSRQQRRTILDPEGRRGPERDDAMELQLAARLMRAQGGDLWVETRPGGGSSFGICLPALDQVGDVAGA